MSASTASEHLSVLVDARLVTCTARGRGRYYRLRGPEVAHALETLGHIAPAAPATGYTGVRAAERLASGRFCYDHLAGRLGVGLTRGWVAAGWLDDPDHLQLTSAGRDGFADLGVDVIGLDALRRPTTRACLDWTERRPHLAKGHSAPPSAHCASSRSGSCGEHGQSKMCGVTDTGAARSSAAEWGVGLSA